MSQENDPIDVEFTVIKEDEVHSAQEIGNASKITGESHSKDFESKGKDVGTFLTSTQKEAYYAAKEYGKVDAEKGDIAWQEMVNSFEGMIETLQLTEKALRENNQSEVAKMHEKMHTHALAVEGLLTLRDNTPDIPLDFRQRDRLETLSILLRAILDAKLWPGEAEREGYWNKSLGKMRYGFRYAMGHAMIEKFPPQRSTSMEPKNRSKDRHILEQKLVQVEDARIAGRRAELKGAAKLLGAYFGYKILKGIFTYPFSEADFKDVMKNLTISKEERRVYIGIPSGYENYVSIYWSAKEADGSATYEKVGQLEKDGSFMIPNRIRGDVEVTVYIEYDGHRVEGRKTTLRF